ncbi:hypothetical protein LIHA111178_04700 [Litorimonas haliclonae]
MGECGESPCERGAATEGATAPETLRSTDRLDVNTLESGSPCVGMVKDPADGVSGSCLKTASVNLSGPKRQQVALPAVYPRYESVTYE